ncbi:MAG: hypothetical protein LH606_00525 [Cytophagaceae bacterium]|nr:hypothetical protein [Cytophagaceae bacterium]
MNLRPYHILLIILTITDAFLLAHPNPVGRIGILFYNYFYLKTFPRALLTVGATIAVAWGLTEVCKRWLSARAAVLALALLLVGAVVILLNVYFKFSSGTYRLTGKAFIYGAHLLPILLIAIFSQGIYDVFRTGKLNR